MRLLAILLILFLGTDCAYAIHTSDIYCARCHHNLEEKFEIRQGLYASHPCEEVACHDSRGEDRHAIHMKICEGCHDGIHGTHKEFDIDCNICHWSPDGWNSSIATIPAYGELYVAESAIMNTSVRVPPWGNDCGYCHPPAAGAKSAHDVHERVIKKACPECHGPGTMFKSAPEHPPGGDEEEEGEAQLEALPLRELVSFFDEIGRQFLRFYDFIRKV